MHCNTVINVDLRNDESLFLFWNRAGKNSDRTLSLQLNKKFKQPYEWSGRIQTGFCDYCKLASRVNFTSTSSLGVTMLSVEPVFTEVMCEIRFGAVRMFDGGVCVKCLLCN